MSARVIPLDPEPRCRCGCSLLVEPASRALECRRGHRIPGSEGLGTLWLDFLRELDASIPSAPDDLDDSNGGPRAA
jgi:hypothetical protein